MPQLDPPSLTKLRLTDLPSGRANASEIPSGPTEWYSFAKAYKRAADTLAAVIAKEPWQQQGLAAPMLFLYRHSIELHLKSLLAGAGELLDEHQEIPRRHFLCRLWGRVRELLTRISPGSDDVWFARADQVIADFDELDEGSYSCRYPVGVNNIASLPKGFMVDPVVVRQVISELDILLDGASIQIEVYRGVKSERFRDGGG